MPKSPNRSNKIPKFVKTLNHILEVHDDLYLG